MIGESGADFKNLQRALDDLLSLQRLNIIGDEKILNFRYMDIPISLYLPDAHTDLIQKEILRTNNFFESGLLYQIGGLIKPGSVVVDAGANIGNHTVFFSKICRASQVIAFEPQAHCFSILLKNIALNNIDGAQCFNRGLGASSGKASISIFKPWNLGGLTLKSDSDGNFKIEPLDALELPKLDFLKIDVEGFQYDVLTGARNTIERARPAIMIEMRDGQDDVDRVDALLRSFGAAEPRRLTTYERLYTFD